MISSSKLCLTPACYSFTPPLLIGNQWKMLKNYCVFIFKKLGMRIPKTMPSFSPSPIFSLNPERISLIITIDYSEVIHFRLLPQIKWQDIIDLHS